MRAADRALYVAKDDGPRPLARARRGRPERDRPLGFAHGDDRSLRDR